MIRLKFAATGECKQLRGDQSDKLFSALFNRVRLPNADVPVGSPLCRPCSVPACPLSLA